MKYKVEIIYPTDHKEYSIPPMAKIFIQNKNGSCLTETMKTELAKQLKKDLEGVR